MPAEVLTINWYFNFKWKLSGVNINVVHIEYSYQYASMGNIARDNIISNKKYNSVWYYNLFNIIRYYKLFNKFHYYIQRFYKRFNQHNK